MPLKLDNLPAHFQIVSGKENKAFLTYNGDQHFFARGPDGSTPAEHLMRATEARSVSVLTHETGKFGNALSIEISTVHPYTQSLD